MALGITSRAYDKRKDETRPGKNALEILKCT